MIEVNLLRRARVSYYSLALSLDHTRFALEQGVINEDLPIPGPGRTQLTEDVHDFLALLRYVSSEEAEDQHAGEDEHDLLLDNMCLFLDDAQTVRFEKFLSKYAIDLLMIGNEGNN